LPVAGIGLGIGLVVAAVDGPGKSGYRWGVSSPALPASPDALDLVLASASPRRAELLARVGLRFVVRPADIDESPRPDERPGDYVVRMASEKASAAAARTEEALAQLPLLAADTIVVLDRRILGKPSGPEEAAEMLGRLAGRRHEVTTAYRIVRGATAVERAVTTLVNFRLLSPAELAAYLASGEWQGKAGAYAVQGIAALFATELRGSFTNVVGLPLAEVVADLRAVGGLPGWPPPSFALGGVP
jgi:septum formation protein